MVKAFQGSLGLDPLTGEITTTVLDPKGPAPTNIIHLKTPWSVKVDWKLEGPSLNMFAGTWVVSIVLEGVGNLFEEVIASIDTISIRKGANGGTATTKGLEYSHTFDIPQDKVKQAGTYRLVTLITSRTMDTPPEPGAFVGFEEAPMLQFYP